MDRVRGGREGAVASNRTKGGSTLLKFTYKLNVKERVRAKCPKHPRYNPELHGQGGIIGGCSTCSDLCDLLDARKKLDAAAREFERRAGAWVVAKDRDAEP
jgi:hypothetical protein